MTRGLGDPPAKRMTGTLARTLYGRPVSSVSRLETFAQCPYQHFVRYGLAPQREQQPGVDAAELGTLYHEAAERFTEAVTARPEFPEVPQAVCDRLMDSPNGQKDGAQHPLAIRGQQLSPAADGVCLRAERSVADCA